jgi:hypothetical protein
MNNTNANLNTLNYLIEQHTQSLVKNATEISIINDYQSKQMTKQERIEIYLKKLLIFRAKRMLVDNVNNYIITLCDMYDGNFINYPPNMEKDTTPEWMIANMILSITSDREKNAFIDIFKYVYDAVPGLYFQ